MNRRDSLKALSIGTFSAAALLEACKPGKKEKAGNTAGKPAPQAGRQSFELERDAKLHDETFFTSDEMKTITLLADIIIPKDSKSGSASDAKVPEFIEFIVKDIPDHQLPMRGGLRWLNLQCLNRYGKDFAACSHPQQIELIDQIAYPEQAKPELAQGVAFFNLMRNLTATGFFTTEMGIKDLGFIGNAPNQWAGVPGDVLKQYGLQDYKV